MSLHNGTRSFSWPESGDLDTPDKSAIGPPDERFFIFGIHRNVKGDLSGAFRLLGDVHRQYSPKFTVYSRPDPDKELGRLAVAQV